MFYCPTCGAVCTDSGHRLIGSRCWFCRDTLQPVEQAPPLDYEPAAEWLPAMAEIAARKNAHAESEV